MARITRKEVKKKKNLRLRGLFIPGNKKKQLFPGKSLASKTTKPPEKTILNSVKDALRARDKRKTVQNGRGLLLCGLWSSERREGSPVPARVRGIKGARGRLSV